MENTYLAIFRYSRQTLKPGESMPAAMRIENCKKNNLKYQRLEEGTIKAETVKNIAKNIYTINSEGDEYVCVTAIKDHTKILLNQKDEKPEVDKECTYLMLVDTEYWPKISIEEMLRAPYIRFQKDVDIIAKKVTEISGKIYVIRDRYGEDFVVIN